MRKKKRDRDQTSEDQSGGGMGMRPWIEVEPPDRRSRGGCHTELGIAIASGKRLFIRGPRENLYHWHEAIQVAANDEELLKMLPWVPK